MNVIQLPDVDDDFGKEKRKTHPFSFGERSFSLLFFFGSANEMKRGTDRTGPVSFEEQRQLVDNEPTDINHYFLPSNDLNPQKALRMKPKSGTRFRCRERV